MTTNTKTSAVARMTETTLNALQSMIASGVAPWNKPWCLAKKKGQMSFSSGKPYSACNQFLLAYQQIILGKTYGAEDEYSTPNQLKKESVSFKGQKTLAIWRPIIKTYLDTENLDENGQPLVKTYVKYTMDLVFNRQSCGLPKHYAPSNNNVYDHTTDEKVMAVVNAYCEANDITLVLSETENSAYQEGNRKTIVIPKITRFKEANEFYSVLFHELTHATALCGCERKCHEDYFKSVDDRAQEELVAELGAATLCSYFGMTSVAEANSAAYLKGWSSKLTTSKANAFIKALSYATKAVEAILGDITETKEEIAA